MKQSDALQFFIENKIVVIKNLDSDLRSTNINFNEASTTIYFYIDN